MYCNHGTLSECFFMESAPPDEAVLMDLCSQLLDALILFENHRIVHNDIKPENIFIKRGKKTAAPMIGDLGLASFTSARSVLSKAPGGTSHSSVTAFL
jgi:serine/threonine protein kinase